MQNKVLNFPNFFKISILSHSELINLMNTDEHGTAVHCEIDETDENTLFIKPAFNSMTVLKVS